MMAPARLSAAVRRSVFDLLRSGMGGVQVASTVGVSFSAVYALRREVGGVLPTRVSYSDRFLDRDERYEIARLTEQGVSVRAVARAIGCSPSTVSREVRRNRDLRTQRYQPERAETMARARQRRPKLRKVVSHPELGEWVQDRLNERYSPEQVAGRIVIDFPDDPRMRISHEAIYQAIYVHPRGELKRQLRAHLRTSRTSRQRRNSPTRRGGQIRDAVSIHDRPDEVADRLVPGHHEGDLILGTVASKSAVATVVERSTGYLVLAHLPDGHNAAAVAAALSRELPAALPAAMLKTLTWDRGREMAHHAQLSENTGLKIYFADPYAPWQRGSNENINGLLREYLPKGTNLAIHTASDLASIATALNNRPRKRLGFRTPAEVMTKLINQDQTSGVATID